MRRHIPNVTERVRSFPLNAPRQIEQHAGYSEKGKKQLTFCGGLATPAGGKSPTFGFLLLFGKRCVDAWMRTAGWVRPRVLTCYVNKRLGIFRLGHSHHR